MIERPHAFGEKKYSLLDTVIFNVRKRQVLRALPALSKQHIADLGSGYDARLLISLLSEHRELQGVAFDMAFKEDVSKNQKLAIVIGDLDNPLAQPNESLDICISLAVLEHLNKPQSFLNEVYRVLNPGGTIVLTTPGPSSKWLLEFLAFKLRIIDADEIKDHKNYFSSADLHRMFVAAGFVAENVQPKTFIFGMNNVVVATK